MQQIILLRKQTKCYTWSNIHGFTTKCAHRMHTNMTNGEFNCHQFLSFSHSIESHLHMIMYEISCQDMCNFGTYTDESFQTLTQTYQIIQSLCSMICNRVEYHRTKTTMAQKNRKGASQII